MINSNLSSRLAVVNLSVSMWAGRANVRAEDLPSNVVDALPPADLATLGTKRLFPRDSLKIFQAIKMRAYNLCCQHGTRFLSGFAVDKNAVPDLCNRMDAIKQDFDNAVQQFLSTYDEGCRNWQAAFPQWAGILANATPTVTEVAKRFSFSYQVFTVASAAPACAGDSLADDIAHLPDSALEDIAADVRVLLRDTYTDKRETINGKGLNPLKGLMDKLDALAFLHTDIARLYDVLYEARCAVEATKGQDKVAVQALRALLVACSTAQGIEAVAASLADTGPQDVWQTFFKPEPVQEPETVQPQEPETAQPQAQEPAVSPTMLINNLLASL